ncbi:MAG: PadR family transcriptional regulator [Anaerolineae bacterium]|nr:PadR family transcriptional regulator [Anaerolineae bacterium]MDW8067349.1 PadR family transcriptional regulator [Anaerolineae bacterium]
MSTSSRQSLPLDKIALGFLMAGPAHGYDLHRRVAQELSLIWHVGMGHLYNALRDLEQAGQVQSTLLPQADRPPRKIYAITPAGREEFLAWVRRPVPAVRDLRAEFPIKLYFLRALGLEGWAELIEAQRTLLSARLAQLEAQYDRADPTAFHRLVLDLRRRQTRAALEWLERLTAEPGEKAGKS